MNKSNSQYIKLQFFPFQKTIFHGEGNFFKIVFFNNLIIKLLNTNQHIFFLFIEINC